MWDDLGPVWSGLVWSGLVWSGTVPRNTIQYNAVQYGTVRHRMMHVVCSGPYIWYSTTENSAPRERPMIPPGTVQNNTSDSCTGGRLWPGAPRGHPAAALPRSARRGCGRGLSTRSLRVLLPCLLDSPCLTTRAFSAHASYAYVN